MKTCILIFVIAMLPITGWATHGTGSDDNSTPGERASCNASFQEACEPHTEIHSEGVAAPIGVLGGGAIEALILMSLLGIIFRAGVVMERRRRQERYVHPGA